MHDPFGRSRLPGDISPEGRVRLIDQLAEDLLSLRMPSPEAALFVGAALTAWLEDGGALDRDHFRVVNRTPAAIWQELQRDDDGGRKPAAHKPAGAGRSP